MSMLTIACVLTGTKYSFEYVRRLKSMVSRHLDHSFDFICLTDRTGEYWPKGIRHIAVDGLDRWWAKMALFDPSVRGPGRTIYMDLDTVIVGDLAPLADWNGDFGICRNFARARFETLSPGVEPPPDRYSSCRYGSCVMSFAPGWGTHVWEAFQTDRERLLDFRFGDQQVIEKLVPDADYFQDALPKGFFLNYRNLIEHMDAPPKDTSIVVFGGKFNPSNCGPPWVREAWKF